MRQCHGVLGARQVVGKRSNDNQSVLIRDGDGEVEIEMSSSWPAGLSSEQARWIARLLCEAADRVDAETAAIVAELDYPESNDDAKKALAE